MVGSIYWFLSMATDLSSCIVTIYDLRTEKVVFDSRRCEDVDIAWEVDYQGFGDYELESFDIYTDSDGAPCIEINIETEEDDE